jgi:hypothetical protein
MKSHRKKSLRKKSSGKRLSEMNAAATKIQSFYKKSVERRRVEKSREREEKRLKRAKDIKDAKKKKDDYDLMDHHILKDINESWLNISHFLRNVWRLYKNNIDMTDYKGNTALMVLSSGYETYMVKFFIDKKANLNVQNQDGNTALHIAINDRRAEIAYLLLQSGADDTIKNNEGETAFEMAVRMNEPYANKKSWERAKAIYLDNSDTETITSLLHYMTMSDFYKEVREAPFMLQEILSYGTISRRRDYLFIDSYGNEIAIILKGIAEAYNALHTSIPYEEMKMEFSYILKFINPKLKKKGFEPILEEQDLYDVLKVAETENEYGYTSIKKRLYPYLRGGRFYYEDEM